VTAIPTTRNVETTSSLKANGRPIVYWNFKILIDYQCPICRREADLLRRLDGGRGRLAFEDITAADFDASKYGRTQDDVMASIHGITSDGTVVSGVEVFRRAYDAVGYGWLLKPTGWPVLKQVSDIGYRWFARNRYRIGRIFGGRDANCDCGPSTGGCQI